jgi:hypothetical protein
MTKGAMADKKLILICMLVAAVAVLAFSPAYADTEPPTVSILSPMHGTSTSPSAVSNSPTGDGFKVQVSVWGDKAISSVAVEYCDGSDPNPDGCTWTSAAATQNDTYDCGTGCGVYEATLSPAQGNDYWLRASATSADGTGYSSDQRTGNDARYTYITLLEAKTGTGTLLARDNSSRLCMDCHKKIVSHSSQNTDTSYGNWQTVCLDCHTPHSTSNIYLIKEQFMTPNSGLKTVKFWNTTTLYNGSGAYVDGGASPPESTQAICQVCHTQTGGATPRWRNSGTTSTHFYDRECTECHFHDGGFKGSGDCNSCHGFPPKPGDGKDPIGGSGGKGAHVALNGAHVDEASLPAPDAATYGPGLTQCYVCHPMDDATHPQGDGAADIAIGVVNSFDGNGSYLPQFLGVPGESDNSTPKTCSNVNCHFGVETPRWSCPGDE